MRGQAWPVLLAPALLSGRRPQASDPGATLALEASAFRRAKCPLWSSLQIQLCLLLAMPQEPWGQAGKAARVSALSPVRTEGPVGTAPHPGWRGQRGVGPRVKQAGCAAPTLEEEEGTGRGAQSPTLSGTGGAGRGHSPARWLPSVLAPLGCTCG